MFDTPFALNAGSFSCGLGDSTGFIITSFMCGGAIKLSKSLKMYRIFCLIHFIFYKLGIQSRAELFSKYGKYGRKAV
jgi:hypothetical protein